MSSLFLVLSQFISRSRYSKCTPSFFGLSASLFVFLWMWNGWIVYSLGKREHIDSMIAASSSFLWLWWLGSHWGGDWAQWWWNWNRHWITTNQSESESTSWSIPSSFISSPRRGFSTKPKNKISLDWTHSQSNRAPVYLSSMTECAYGVRSKTLEASPLDYSQVDLIQNAPYLCFYKPNIFYPLGVCSLALFAERYVSNCYFCYFGFSLHA